MKWTATACLILAVGCLHYSAPSARSNRETYQASNHSTVPSSSAELPFAQTRADTLFLFAASSPGAWGQPGTTARGYDCDGGGGRDDASCERTGWFGVDKTAQGASTRWHLESTNICAGSDTDMSDAGQPASRDAQVIALPAEK